MSNAPTRSLSRSVGSSHPFSFAQIRPQLTDEIHLKDPENCRSIFEGRPLARAFSRCSLRAGVVGLSATSRRSNPTGVMIPKYNTAITIRVVTNEVAPPRSSMRVQPAREGVGHQERSKTARSDLRGRSRGCVRISAAACTQKSRGCIGVSPPLPSIDVCEL